MISRNTACGNAPQVFPSPGPLRPRLGRAIPNHEEHPLAISKRPSYLKRQKEQQRIARANEKREARRARKHSTETQVEDPEALDPMSPDSPDSQEAQEAEGAPEGESSRG